MSDDQLQAFTQALTSDASLLQRLQAAANADPVVAIAKEAGFVITAETFNQVREGAMEQELSDAELEYVSGGAAAGYAKPDLE